MEGILSNPTDFLVCDATIEAVTIFGLTKWMGGIFSLSSGSASG